MDLQLGKLFLYLDVPKGKKLQQQNTIPAKVESGPIDVLLFVSKDSVVCPLGFLTCSRRAHVTTKIVSFE